MPWTPSTGSSAVPSGRPTWRRALDVALVLLVLAGPALARYRSGTVAVGWLVGSFLALVCLAGPVAWSPVGQRVGAWFRRIGVTGRVVVIAVLAGVVLLSSETVGLSELVVDSAILGGLGGVLVVLLAEWAGLPP